MPPFSKYATASNLFSISWEAFLLEAKAYFPTTSIAGGFFMLKRTKKLCLILDTVLKFNYKISVQRHLISSLCDIKALHFVFP